MSHFRARLLVGLAALSCSWCAAAEPGPPQAPIEQSTKIKVLKALTPVEIELLDPVGSKTSKTFDTFRIELIYPISLGGKDIVPAGTEGIGEVVHAKRGGGMGAAGELVIAARFLDFDGAKIPLRSTKIALAGESRVGTVNTIAVASAASPLPIGLIGFFIKGGEIELPAGTRATAKIASDVQLAEAASPDPAQHAQDENFNGGNE